MNTPRPECGRYDLHNPEMWTVTGTPPPGALPAFTEDNYDAARICNTVCRVLATCRLRAITAPPGQKPRGFIQGGLYFDDRGQPHHIPTPPPTIAETCLKRLHHIQKQLNRLGKPDTPATQTEHQTLIQQRRETLHWARTHAKIPTKQLAQELGYTTSFIYKQTTETP